MYIKSLTSSPDAIPIELRLPQSFHLIKTKIKRRLDKVHASWVKHVAPSLSLSISLSLSLSLALFPSRSHPVSQV